LYWWMLFHCTAIISGCPLPACWSDIFRVQTRRVSQTIVFRYREIGGRLCTKRRKK
jgi:hypothetical protein